MAVTRIRNDDVYQWAAYSAVYDPLRTSDLSAEVCAFIGQRFVWHPLWVIEPDEGRYAGQWAMQVNRDVLDDAACTIGWAPFCDLDDVVELAASS